MYDTECETNRLVGPLLPTRRLLHNKHLVDDIFKFIFLKEYCVISIKISLKFAPSAPIKNKTKLKMVPQIAGRRTGDKPLIVLTMVWFTEYCQLVDYSYNTRDH